MHGDAGRLRADQEERFRMNQAMLLRYDPRLIEEAVFLALRDRRNERIPEKARGRL